MANWKYKIDFAEWYHDESLSVTDKAQRAAATLRNCQTVAVTDRPALNEMADAFDVVETVDDFDDVMEQLYDWGDAEVPPYSAWPPNKLAWINTVGKVAH